MHSIKPVWGEWSPSYINIRKEETLLARLRIGHTHYTHCDILKGDPPPECISCQCPLTVRHILLECAEFILVRQKYYDVQTSKERVDSASIQRLFEYLKDLNLFSRL